MRQPKQPFSTVVEYMDITYCPLCTIECLGKLIYEMLQKTVLYHVPDCDFKDLVEFTLQQGSLQKNSTGGEFIHNIKRNEQMQELNRRAVFVLFDDKIRDRECVYTSDSPWPHSGLLSPQMERSETSPPPAFAALSPAPPHSHCLLNTHTHTRVILC